jgi:hypothetical protein
MISIKQISPAICFALAAASCSSLQSNDSSAMSQTTSVPTIQDDNSAAEAAQTSVAEEHNACPSPEFSKFLRAFSNSADVQRQFTKFPLDYGQLFDPGAPDTKQEYKRQTIKSFEKIPTFDRQNGGIIIPSERQRAKAPERLIVLAKGERERPEYPGERKSPDDMVAMLHIEDTGFDIYYRFQRVDGCWFLRAIHAKSTYPISPPSVFPIAASIFGF